jgi:hypothetical protein
MRRGKRTSQDHRVDVEFLLPVMSKKDASMKKNVRKDYQKSKQK